MRLPCRLPFAQEGTEDARHWPVLELAGQAVLLPEREKLPQWAAYGGFYLSVRGDVLRCVRSLKPEAMPTVVTSVSERFAKPTELSMSRSDSRWADWRGFQGRSSKTSASTADACAC